MEKNKELRVFAEEIRVETLKELANLGFGHIGGSMSVVELLAVLYGREMRIDPQNPQWEDRDKLVMSKGHAGPAVYATLALKGYFPREELLTLNQGGTHFPSHCDRLKTTGVDMTTGSLGQGISTACGMALAGKVQKKDYRVYTLLGDGEIQEGQVWEACMFASHYSLDNLCVIIDNNGLQIDGDVAKVMSPYPIDEKLTAFGFAVQTIDGHDLDAIDQALNTAKTVTGKPSAIILKTVKGKGVSFMENVAGWHGVAPNDEQYAQAMAELNQQLAEMEGR